MAHALDSRATSPANDLRDALSEVERMIVEPRAETVEKLLTSLDKISTMFGDLTQTEIDLRPEEARWEGILRRVHSRPGRIASAINAAGGFEKLRSQNPPAEEEWWQLDQLINQRRRKAIINGVRVLAIVVVVLGAIYICLLYTSDAADE